MTWNNFYGLKQTIVACWDRPLLDTGGRYELHEPAHATDVIAVSSIYKDVKRFNRDKTAYALTLDSDSNFHLWVSGNPIPIPDDGGDDE